MPLLENETDQDSTGYAAVSEDETYQYNLNRAQTALNMPSPIQSTTESLNQSRQSSMPSPILPNIHRLTLEDSVLSQSNDSDQAENPNVMQRSNLPRQHIQDDHDQIRLSQGNSSEHVETNSNTHYVMPRPNLPRQHIQDGHDQNMLPRPDLHVFDPLQLANQHVQPIIPQDPSEFESREQVSMQGPPRLPPRRRRSETDRLRDNWMSNMHCSRRLRQKLKRTKK